MPESNELDDLDAIHRDATSLPWDGEWEVVEEPDEYGYYPQREVWAGEDSMHLATFAYLQHLELFLAALRLPALTREMHILCYLADAAREDREGEEPCWLDAVGHCHQHDNPPPCPVGRLDAALARLDGEDTG